MDFTIEQKMNNGIRKRLLGEWDLVLQIQEFNNRWN